MKQLYIHLRILITMVLLILSPVLLFGQTKISGTVTDENQEPMIGVNVLIKGTTIGTVTDVSGHYSINASKGQTLVFKYVGYSQQTIAVGDETIYNVNFKVDSK